MDIRRDLEWIETFGLAKQLWPSWDPTDAQGQVWQSKLAHRNPQAVRAAIADAMAEHPVAAPRLAWVVDKLKAASPKSRRDQYSFALGEHESRDQEQDRMRAELARLQPGSLRGAFDAAVPAMLLVTTGRKMPAPGRELPDALWRRHGSDVSEWPPMLVGLVWAAAQQPCAVCEREIPF